ncbi:uncharacterized protein LOC144534355 isoform X2 [Sander vitreus]
MTRFSPVLAFLLIYFLHPDFGECVTVILGDSYVFRNCQTDGQAYLYRVVEGKSAQHITGKVATREEDVWKPAKDYEDRMKIKAFISFSRTEYSDTGLYELRCPGQPDNSTQLDIVLASEVLATEGGNATLPCYYITGGHVESIKWSRGGEMVLEQNLSSGEIKHGPGFKKRLSLSPDGNKKGNWALMFNPVLLEDGGDYFCSFHQNQNGAPEGRGDPAAVRMRVAERRRDQTTGRPYLTVSEVPLLLI